MTLEQRRTIQKLILVYKYNMRVTLITFRSITPYVRDVNQYNFRNSNDLAIIPARSKKK